MKNEGAKQIDETNEFSIKIFSLWHSVRASRRMRILIFLTLVAFCCAASQEERDGKGITIQFKITGLLSKEFFLCENI